MSPFLVCLVVDLEGTPGLAFRLRLALAKHGAPECIPVVFPFGPAPVLPTVHLHGTPGLTLHVDVVHVGLTTAAILGRHSEITLVFSRSKIRNKQGDYDDGSKSVSKQLMDN